MKVEDHINRRCADAAKKAGLLGVWPAKTSRRGERVHTIVGEEEVRCGKCGKTSWGQHWSAVRERDGTDYADCPYCYTTLKLVGPGASGSKRLFSDRPHRVADDGRVKCGSCGQTTDRKYWTEFGCGSEKWAACSYCGDSRELEGARRSRRSDRPVDMARVIDGVRAYSYGMRRPIDFEARNLDSEEYYREAIRAGYMKRSYGFSNPNEIYEYLLTPKGKKLEREIFGPSGDEPGARRSRREGGLSMDEIEKLASRAGVKRVAVENFLMGVSPSTGRIDDHLANLEMDARLYKWNAATVAAIRAGISKAYH